MKKNLKKKKSQKSCYKISELQLQIHCIFKHSMIYYFFNYGFRISLHGCPQTTAHKTNFSMEVYCSNILFSISIPCFIEQASQQQHRPYSDLLSVLAHLGKEISQLYRIDIHLLSFSQHQPMYHSSCQCISIQCPTLNTTVFCKTRTVRYVYPCEKQVLNATQMVV